MKSIMDCETGENEPDKETGEVPASAKVDSETGEAELNTRQERSSRKFKIPNQNPRSSKNEAKKIDGTDETPFQKDIIACIVILLPTTLFFYPLLGMCVSLLEVILHLWVHKKNKSVENLNIFYRSPLHIICREFCAVCKEERNLKQIFRLQGKLNHRYNINVVSST